MVKGGAAAASSSSLAGASSSSSNTAPPAPPGDAAAPGKDGENIRKREEEVLKGEGGREGGGLFAIMRVAHRARAWRACVVVDVVEVTGFVGQENVRE
jgi:hypothetical protein